MLARVLVSAAVSLALVLTAAGCGDDGSDPADTVRSYLLAIVEQDGERACEQFTDSLRSEIEQSSAAEAGGRSCADVMELAAGLNPALTADEVDQVEIEVEEDGDQATATLVNPLVEREETIELTSDDGDWKIATLETRPRG